MNDLQGFINDCYSISDVCRKTHGYVNGTSTRAARKMIEKYGLDTSHFDGGISKKVKYATIIKECPICGKSFETKLGHRKEKTVCSRGCSNTYFRSGEDHPNYKEEISDGYYGYRRACFEYHDKRCVVCGEDKIVAVHHMDENNKNNDPKNLVPLCPTHHGYWHSRYRHLIEEQVFGYIEEHWSPA